jgi:hypothetical protein
MTKTGTVVKVLWFERVLTAAEIDAIWRWWR